MQKIKLFKGVETDTASLESDINKWLEANNARVVQMSGNIAPQSGNKSGLGGGSSSFAPSDVMVILLYETD